MRVEFDPQAGESIIRVNVQEKALLLLALDLAMLSSVSTRNHEDLNKMRGALAITETDVFEKRMNNYWENPR